MLYYSILDAVYDFAVPEKWYKTGMEEQIFDKKYPWEVGKWTRKSMKTSKCAYPSSLPATRDSKQQATLRITTAKGFI